MYVFSGACRFEALADEKVRITGLCVFTGKPHSLVVGLSGLRKVHAGGRLATCMPELTADEREFLMSGISPTGWDDTFPLSHEEEEEDE